MGLVDVDLGFKFEQIEVVFLIFDFIDEEMVTDYFMQCLFQTGWQNCREK